MHKWEDIKGRKISRGRRKHIQKLKHRMEAQMRVWKRWRPNGK